MSPLIMASRQSGKRMSLSAPMRAAGAGGVLKQEYRLLLSILRRAVLLRNQQGMILPHGPVPAEIPAVSA